jgi:GTP cyclohydrolase IA
MVATALAPAAVDVSAAQKAVRDLLTALGQPIDDDTEDTPRRVAAAFNEMLTAPPFELTTFANDEHYDELVVVRDIPVQSLCAHHLLPFIGVAHVAYLPGERIVGLSKLARAVGMWSRGLQVQERLSSQIAGWLDERLRPRGVGVVIEAEHLCMTLRGVQAHGARTVTSTLRGQVRDDPSTRAEFLGLARH